MISKKLSGYLYLFLLIASFSLFTHTHQVYSQTLGAQGYPMNYGASFLGLTFRDPGTTFTLGGEYSYSTVYDVFENPLFFGGILELLFNSPFTSILAPQATIHPFMDSRLSLAAGAGLSKDGIDFFARLSCGYDVLYEDILFTPKANFQFVGSDFQIGVGFNVGARF